MNNIISSIKKSIKQENWYSALVQSLILPDICGKIENNKKASSVRYCEWFKIYMNKYTGYLTGEDCYALRCSFLHEGSEIIENQRIKETLDRFIFISDGPHCNRLSNMSIGDSRYDGKELLQLSVKNFCNDIISGVNEWLKYNEDNTEVKKNLTDMLEIHENGFSIDNAIKFKNK